MMKSLLIGVFIAIATWAQFVHSAGPIGGGGGGASTAIVNSDGYVSVATQFDKTNTTLADVTGLTVALATAKRVGFHARLFIDASAGGGGKYAVAYSGTNSEIIYQIHCVDDATNQFVITARQTSSGGSSGQTGMTAGFCTLQGGLVTTSTGNLTIQFAQQSASGTSSVLPLSDMRVWYGN